MRRKFASYSKYRHQAHYGTVVRKRHFHSLVVTRSSLAAIACIVSIVLFITCAVFFIHSKITCNKSVLLKAGISNAMPFLSVEKQNISLPCIDVFKILSRGSIIDERTVFLRAVPFLTFVNVTKEHIKTPNEKNANISDRNDASKGIKIKNETDYNIDANALLTQASNLNISPDKPSVLIVHTHASESYTPSKTYNYIQTGNYRTQDTSFNMIRVGEELKNHLEKGGINVIHDKTINDYPAYNSSYNKTEKVILDNLSKYPSIKMVFDIHRDAVGDDENGVKFSADINGKKTAQVMIVCGSDCNLENPLWQQNLSLALKIQKHFETNCPNLLRPLNLRKERFNMHLTTGSLLFEVGTNYNTLDEALNAAACLGDGLCKVIKNLD